MFSRVLGFRCKCDSADVARAVVVVVVAVAAVAVVVSVSLSLSHLLPFACKLPVAPCLSVRQRQST